ncbi:heterokaryon incompatibility protein-domain-containing protein [Daldinia sp. FL1419]|nr:heterokaryon incompatibility protein-domain-containing protein [Daldinia sp. FL1419]
MWFLNTEKLTLEYFNDAQVKRLPYAVLSHTWGSDEILFHEFADGREALQSRTGWRKMTRFCETALRHGFKHAWMDACCIDKRNSADLSEAINSMYKYYYKSAACFIYLEDVHKYADEANSLPGVQVTRDQLLTRVKATRWVTRGWTLQELIAPKQRFFLASDWSQIEDGQDLLDTLVESTGIDKELLQDRDLMRNFCIAERMKWASRRQTTRAEDVAYCLMGIFNVNMPVLYGEGARNAFNRLQREIMQSSFDMTIFIWYGNYASSGLLARSPSDFADAPPSSLWAPWNLSAFSMTNIGLSIGLNIGEGDEIDDDECGEKVKVAALQCNVQTSTGQWEIPVIYLKLLKAVNFSYNGERQRSFRRVRCAERLTIPSNQLEAYPYQNIIVLQDEQYQLVRRAGQQYRSRVVAWGGPGGLM